MLPVEYPLVQEFPNHKVFTLVELTAIDCQGYCKVVISLCKLFVST